MNVPKNHHYVPQLLLRNFANDRGQLHFFRKDKAHEGVKSAAPDRLFAMTHMNSKFLEDGSKDISLEQDLGILETEAKAVFHDIALAIRAEQLPSISPSQREVIAFFHYIQWKRSWDHRQTFLSDKAIFDLADQAVAKAQARFPDKLEEIEQLSSALRTRQYIHNLRVDLLRTVNPDTIDLLKSRALLFAVPEKSTKSWIIGSSPVVKMGSADLNDLNSELWLPVAPDLAIGFWRKGEKDRMFHVPNHAIRRMNRLIALQSGMFAGRSEALIRSLAGHPLQCAPPLNIVQTTPGSSSFSRGCPPPSSADC